MLCMPYIVNRGSLLKSGLCLRFNLGLAWSMQGKLKYPAPIHMGQEGGEGTQPIKSLKIEQDQGHTIAIGNRVM